MNRAQFIDECMNDAPDAGTPLLVLGYEVDRSDPEELYAALCWIEANLIELLTLQARNHAVELEGYRSIFLGLCLGLGVVVALSLIL